MAKKSQAAGKSAEEKARENAANTQHALERLKTLGQTEKKDPKPKK